MIKGKRITRPNGLKAEDCAVIAQAAGKFKSSVQIIKQNHTVNAKSIMGLISLNIQKDEYIYLAVQGEDEQSAFKTVYALL
ncbi:MAG: HPr family phosphocarrier protein [Clostridia bacterium]|nr:HPr family phosphocarrier protein [Clostridia bacterium]